jgi:hypothetical protein
MGGKGVKKAGPPKKAGLPANVDQRQLDMSGLNLGEKDDAPSFDDAAPAVNFAQDKLVEEVRKSMEAQGGKDNQGLSIVVIGKLVVFLRPSKCGFF